MNLQAFPQCGARQSGFITWPCPPRLVVSHVHNGGADRAAEWGAAVKSSAQSLAWLGPSALMISVISPHHPKNIAHSRSKGSSARKGGETRSGQLGAEQMETWGRRDDSPQNHHVEGVVGNAGDEGREGDDEDGREQEVGTGGGARSCLC